jgi:hypothetical protein
VPWTCTTGPLVWLVPSTLISATSKSRSVTGSATPPPFTMVGFTAGRSSWFDPPRWVRHHWWDQPAQSAIDDAGRRADHRPAYSPQPDAVVAELGFGFWRHLVTVRYEQSFWVPILDCAFTAVPGRTAAKRRETLDSRMRILHRLRIRVAHHEPPFKPAVLLGSGRIRSSTRSASRQRPCSRCSGGSTGTPPGGFVRTQRQHVCYVTDRSAAGRWPGSLQRFGRRICGERGRRGVQHVEEVGRREARYRADGD